jgi:hypothetical protein
MKLLFTLSTLTILLTSCASPITATSNKVGDLEGKSCSRNILFIIPLGIDASIYSAAKNGGINEISTVDQSSLFTGLYNQTCTIVHGK